MDVSSIIYGGGVKVQRRSPLSPVQHGTAEQFRKTQTFSFLSRFETQSNSGSPRQAMLVRAGCLLLVLRVDVGACRQSRSKRLVLSNGQRCGMKCLEAETTLHGMVMGTLCISAEVRIRFTLLGNVRTRTNHLCFSGRTFKVSWFQITPRVVICSRGG